MGARIKAAFVCSIALLVLFPRTSAAASLTVSWDPPADPTVVGYIVSYGTQSGSYTDSIDSAGQTSVQVSTLTGGVTYYFVVQSYDAARMLSMPSDEVAAAAPSAQLVNPPTITCPVITVASSTGLAVPVSYTGLTVVGGALPVTTACAPTSGSLFPVGTTPFNCSTTDALGQTAACNSTVTVTPPPAPSIACPLISATTSSNGLPVAVTYPDPAVTDGAQPIVTTCTPPSGSLFGVGTTTVACTALDALQRAASCSTPVVVSPPPPAAPLAITCPTIPTVISPSGKPTTVTYSSPLTSGGVAPVTTVCAPQSGSKFPLGTTIVTCTAQDAASQIASCSTTVTVTRKR